ncbi:MAG: hypothetical protein QNJ47_22260 [Nostocaceae cyanobacterium]|nr:hypothetical protein [Nostocaceae cyanobacterium]
MSHCTWEALLTEGLPSSLFLPFDGLPGLAQKPTLYACATCRSMSRSQIVSIGITNQVLGVSDRQVVVNFCIYGLFTHLTGVRVKK